MRVNALCPQFTDTALVSQQMAGVGEAGAKKILAETGGGLLTVEQVGHLPEPLLAELDNKGAAEYWYSHALNSELTYNTIMDNCEFDSIGPLRRTTTQTGASATSKEALCNAALEDSGT